MEQLERHRMPSRQMRAVDRAKPERHVLKRIVYIARDLDGVEPGHGSDGGEVPVVAPARRLAIGERQGVERARIR